METISFIFYYYFEIKDSDSDFRNFKIDDCSLS